MFLIKKGIRQNNQAPYKLFNFRLFDKVNYKGQKCFITGRRKSGYFCLKDINNNLIGNGSVSYKKLQFIESASNFIVQPISVSLV